MSACFFYNLALLCSSFIVKENCLVDLSELADFAASCARTVGSDKSGIATCVGDNLSVNDQCYPHILIEYIRNLTC